MAEIMLVASGKGGVGKSVTCAMLGAELARRGKKVLVLEMDSGLRGMDIIFGVEDAVVFDLADILMSRCPPIKAIMKCPYQNGLELIVAPFDHNFVPNKEDLTVLCKGLSKYYDYLILDTPAGLGKNFDVALTVADKALLVVTPDLISVRDGKKISDVIIASGVHDIKLIINKVDTKAVKTKGIRDLDDVIDKTGVQLIAVVPFEEKIIEYTSKGEALPIANSAYRAYRNLAARIEGIYTELLFT